jgi:TRAP-type C4-dicarboxylate transport system permease small subunit
MHKIRNILDRTLEILSAMLLALITLLVLWQIFTRTILDDPSTLTEETVRFSFVWLSMLTAAYVVGTKGHMAVTLLSDKLDGDKQKILEIVLEVLFILFSIIIMIYGGIRSVQITMPQTSPAMGLPMGFVYMAVPVSGVLMLIYSVLNLYDVFNNDFASRVDMREENLETEDSIDLEGNN